MNVYLILTLVIGLIVCLAGYKFNKLLIVIAAIVGGFTLGMQITANLNVTETTQTLISAIIAILFGILSFKLYLLGIFLLCFSVTYGSCYSLITIENLKIIISVIAGIIVGILAVKFTAPIMIITTSISGAITISKAILGMLSINSLILQLVIIILMAITGLRMQFQALEGEE